MFNCLRVISWGKKQNFLHPTVESFSALLLVLQKWLQATDLPKDVYQHLACYVPKIYCLGPNLNPQSEELLAQLLLQAPMEWYLCGEEPSIGLAKLEQNNQPSQLCGHVFKVGEPTYSCR